MILPEHFDVRHRSFPDSMNTAIKVSLTVGRATMLSWEEAKKMSSHQKELRDESCVKNSMRDIYHFIYGDLVPRICELRSICNQIAYSKDINKAIDELLEMVTPDWLSIEEDAK